MGRRYSISQVELVLTQCPAESNRTSLAFSPGLLDLRSIGMVVHLSRIMLVVGQHLPISADECNTKSGSGSLLLNPGLQGPFCRILRQEFRKNHRSGFETAFLVVYIIGVNPVGHKTI